MFKLVRYFVLTSMVAFIVVIATLGRLYTERSTEDLIGIEESKSAALTRALANSIRDELRDFLLLSAELSSDELRSRAESAALRESVVAQIEGQDIVKVKVYQLSGLTIFSTEPAQVGEIQFENPGFQSALKGKIDSKLTHRDTFNAYDGVIENRDVLASYIPIHDTGTPSEVVGVFEVYNDVTPLLLQLERTQRAIFGGVATILGLLYLFLFFIIRRADQIIRSQSEQLQAASAAAEQANLAKSEFVAFVTHELRNPLTVMQSYTKLLERSGQDSGDGRRTRYLAAIQGSIARMTALTSDLMDISRMETGLFSLQTESISVPEVVEEVNLAVRNLLEEKQQSMMLDLPDSLPAILADRSRLYQIVSNLVSNAHKYTPVGGSISISARALSANGKPAQVEVAVADSGIGISPEDQSKVFQRFFRSDDARARRESGTGLGLFLTKNLVEMQGGSISFESSLDQGTKFRFTLPAIAD